MAALDRHIVEWMADLHWPVVTPAMKGLTYAGAAAIVWIVIAAAVAVWLRRPLVLIVMVVFERLSAITDGVVKAAIGVLAAVALRWAEGVVSSRRRRAVDRE